MKLQFIVKSEAIANNACRSIMSNWRALNDAGTPLQVDTGLYKKKRTNPQNALYWSSLVHCTSEQVWLDGRRLCDETWHGIFKVECLPDECAKQDKFGQRIKKWIYVGGERFLNMSTTDLNTAEFSEYYARVEAYCVSDLGVVLSDYR